MFVSAINVKTAEPIGPEVLWQLWSQGRFYGAGWRKNVDVQYLWKSANLNRKIRKNNSFWLWLETATRKEPVKSCYKKRRLCIHQSWRYVLDSLALISRIKYFCCSAEANKYYTVLAKPLFKIKGIDYLAQTQIF